MPYYPDPYAGIGSGITSMGESLSKAITGYYEDKDKGDFANRMMDEFMKIPGAVPEDMMSKFPKMSSTQKSDALVAVQWRMARAAQQVKQQHEDEDRQITNRMHMASADKDIADAAKTFAAGTVPQLGTTVPTDRGAGIVTSVPGGGSISLPPAATPRTDQVDMDAQGNPKVDLQRNIYYSGGVPMALTGDLRKQFEDAQSQSVTDTKGIEGQIAHQQAAGGKPLPAAARYASREDKLAALRAQRQSKLGMFGTPAGSGAPAAVGPIAAPPAPSPAAAAIAPDRVVVMSPPDARGQRQTYTIPHQQLQPFLNANRGWSVMPATQPAAAPPAPQANAGNFGAPGPGAYPSQDEQDMQDLLAV
jgi:hypothetical protein